MRSFDDKLTDLCCWAVSHPWRIYAGLAMCLISPFIAERFLP